MTEESIRSVSDEAVLVPTKTKKRKIKPIIIVLIVIGVIALLVVVANLCWYSSCKSFINNRPESFKLDEIFENDYIAGTENSKFSYYIEEPKPFKLMNLINPFSDSDVIRYMRIQGSDDETGILIGLHIWYKGFGDYRYGLNVNKQDNTKIEKVLLVEFDDIDNIEEALDEEQLKIYNQDGNKELVNEMLSEAKRVFDAE